MAKARPETELEKLRNQLTPVMMLPDIFDSFARKNYTELMKIPGFTKLHAANNRAMESKEIAGNTLRNMENR